MSAAKKNSLEQGISPISQEEFIRDFLPLPILHRGILFVLRTGYLIKQSPLEDLDVLGLCPTHTAEEEGALHVVLRRFFNRDASFWRSAACSLNIWTWIPSTLPATTPPTTFP